MLQNGYKASGAFLWGIIENIEINDLSVRQYFRKCADILICGLHKSRINTVTLICPSE